MKNILKYILSFAFCVGVIFTTTTTVNAEDSYDVMYPEDVWKVGDIAYYKATHYLENGNYYTVDYQYEITSEDECRTAILYLLSNSNSVSGYVLDDYNNVLPGGTLVGHNVETGETSSSSNLAWSRLSPYPHTTRGYTSSVISTNIPIFKTKEDADAYASGNAELNTALNYKKSYENGSWVKPFEDIEINDSNMSSPQLANVSHNGFTVVNVPDERYMVDVYLESGVQNPLPYEKSLTSIGDALFINSFGLVSDTEGAFTGEIDLLSCYGVDNVSALNESVSQFYSTYPSINAFNDSLPMDTLQVNKPTWSIWGQPFGKSFVFFTKSSSATGTVSAENCPLAYTNYKVRYFYYDDDSGFHYGPWTNFIYFSDGRVMRGEVFQGNDGNIIESPLESGTQDSSGNVSMNYGSLVDIENPNELFGYLRSLINNINATGNNFMTLFGTVFSFLPSDLLAIIWLGIGCMILIGIIRAFN